MMKPLDSNADTRGTLIFGATGQQGGAVARALTGSAHPLRAFVRDPGTAASRALSASGIELAVGDLSDERSLRLAMEGIDSVFSVQPNSGSPGSGITDVEEVRIGNLIGDVAVDAGVRHLIYSSAGIISRGPTGVANLDCKLEIEQHVSALSIPTTIVRPATFMELLATPALWIAERTLSFFASAGTMLELVAVDDIGRAVRVILDDPGRFDGEIVDLAGDRLSGHEIQTALRTHVDAAINYSRFPDEALEKQPALARTIELFDAGRANGNADLEQLETAFGPLTRFGDWLDGPPRYAIRRAAGLD
jgi:uncharacterized protein YbjT (DUF2867 family)